MRAFKMSQMIPESPFIADQIQDPRERKIHDDLIRMGFKPIGISDMYTTEEEYDEMMRPIMEQLF